MSDALVIREPGGTVTVLPAVLEQVVQRAAEAVDGARVRRPRRALEVFVDGSSARVELELAVRYGEVVPLVAEAVQREVGTALRATCGLEPAAVDVAVEELDR